MNNFNPQISRGRPQGLKSSSAPPLLISRIQTAPPQPTLVNAAGKHLTHVQGIAARGVLRYLQRCQPGTTPDAQLLALILTLRAARYGTASYAAADLSSLRLLDGASTLTELVATGWLCTRLEDVLAPSAARPASIRIPDLYQEPTPIYLGEKTRASVASWVLKAKRYHRLRKLTSEVCLSALYLAAHGHFDGRGSVGQQDLIATCALPPGGSAATLASALLEAGWLDEYRIEPSGVLRYRLHQRAVPFSPAAPSVADDRVPPARLSGSAKCQ
ncbi:hypothetical protein P8605_11395 [Streptomyces sp. T-3]|nr:hypothetical protein [Streptomyces sp. T-3]